MGLHLRGNIVGYEELKAPKKLVVTGARNTFEAHHMFDQVDFHQKECLPFYDLHLKGANNAFMDASPVKIFVRGANVWRSEEEWPPQRAQRTPFYLRKGPSGSVISLNDGGLSTQAPPPDEPSTSYTYPDWEWVNGVVVNGPDGRPDFTKRVLTFTTAPLERDLEVTGPIVLKLFASSTAIDTQIHRQAVRPESAGRRRAPIRRAALAHARYRRAGSRPRTARRTWPGRRRCGRSTPTRNPQPLTPGEIYQFDIEVLPVSYVFKKGHRIRLEIVNGNSPVTDGVFNHPYHPTQMGTDTIHHDATHASCIVLPVIAPA